MGRIITSPEGMTFEDWCSQVSIELKAYIPQMTDNFGGKSEGDEWRLGAYTILQDKRFKNVPIPDKIVYPVSDKKAWQRWAFDWMSSGQNT